MIRFCTLLLTVAPLTAAAGPDRISTMLGSHHLGTAVSFEELNPGAFLTWEDQALGLDWTVGAYRNSYGRGSIAVTAALPVVTWSGAEVALFAGLAYYPENGRHFAVHAGDVVPIGGLQLRHNSAFMQIIPSDGQFADAVVAFGFTFELGE